MIITQIAPYGTMVLLILPDDKNIPNQQGLSNTFPTPFHRHSLLTRPVLLRVATGSKSNRSSIITLFHAFTKSIKKY